MYNRESTLPSLWRKLIVFAATVAIAFVGLAVNTPSAHADADGCHPEVGLNYVCVNVQGRGLQVDWVEAKYHYDIDPPCDARLYITFFGRDNKKYEQQISERYTDCNTWHSFQRGYNGRDMQEGRVCGALEKNGRLEPGACVSISR